MNWNEIMEKLGCKKKESKTMKTKKKIVRPKTAKKKKTVKAKRRAAK